MLAMSTVQTGSRPLSFIAPCNAFAFVEPKLVLSYYIKLRYALLIFFILRRLIYVTYNTQKAHQNKSINFCRPIFKKRTDRILFK